MINGIKNTWKRFDELKNIDHKYYCSYYYDASNNKWCQVWTIIKVL